MSSMIRTPFHLAAVFAAVLAVSFVCPSCLIGSHSHTQVSGSNVGPETLAQIQPGKTKPYVTALIGEPTDVTRLEDGTEIAKWNYTESRDSSGGVIFLFASDSKTETKHTTYVEYKDGVVVRAWRD